MAPASGARPGRLHGKVALVSGAAHGLGASIAEAFAREGARVFVGDVDAAGVRALAARLQMPGLVLDVREEMAWIAAIAQVLDASGRLDVLVNCARITAIEPDDASARARRHDPEHAALADWQAVYRTNLDGVFLGCKHAIRAMRRGRRGAILNLSPTGGTADAGATPAHGSSQAAVCSHTHSLAAYCLQQGLAIRCHALLPATTAVAAADVASLAVFLASDESAGITGAEIRLDGCRFVPPAA